LITDHEVSDLPISFRHAKDDRGRSCYISHLFGIVTLDIKPFQAAERAINGGILADEMGLGKTITAISLITLQYVTNLLKVYPFPRNCRALDLMY